VNLGLPIQIEDLWLDWVDKDSEVKGLGAEDHDYASFQVPYRTPNRLVTDLSEIMLLRDITADYFALITQYACLLPDSRSQINVNTAPGEILQILGEGSSLSEMNMLTENQRAFESPAKFLESYPKFQKSLSRLTTSSMYFEMHAQAKIGSTTVSLISLMYRNPKDGKISVLKRDFGKLFKSKLILKSQVQAI
jgi:type II secretory pathway component PulK